ncbi:MAG: UMP kinase [Phycisphaerae bacterium]
MSPQKPYRRVLIKLSGETLGEESRGGISSDALAKVADELSPVVASGVQVAVVVGAGNIVRGRTLATDENIARNTADAMGMMATYINALALRDTLCGRGMPAVTMGAFAAGPYVPLFTREDALDALAEGKVVILAGGTGNPYFTTDSCASLRAAQMDVEVILKATQVDGVYDCDPRTNPEAKKFDALTFDEALQRRLGIMDATAFDMCRQSGIDVLVFRFAEAGNLARAVAGEPVGTVVSRA